MAQIWLHSDWHWLHENIYHFTYTDSQGIQRRVREQFQHAKEADVYIEQRWRDLIRPQDHVYVLGDLTMYRENHMSTAFVALWKSLPGHKRLILGNHDHLKPKWYVEAGFQKIRGAHILDRILLSHIPVHPSAIPAKLLGNVHGHTHAHEDIGPRYLNVCVERTNYEPVPLEWAQEQLRQKQLAQSLNCGLVDVQGNPVTGP